MENYKEEFLAFVIHSGALKFGNFVLKSGRTSPYFFDTGAFSSGKSLSQLAKAYAYAINDTDIDFEVLFGPAYKGIPLVCTIAVAWSEIYVRDIGFCFNRKEQKNHGERGLMVGWPVKGKILIVDDVISAGTSIRESIKIIKDHEAFPTGVMITLDRQERGESSISAAEEVRRNLGLKVESIVTFSDIVQYLEAAGNYEMELKDLKSYHQIYGAENE